MGTLKVKICLVLPILVGWFFAACTQSPQEAEQDKIDAVIAGMSLEEKVDLAKRHFLKSLECKGEKVGVLEMRRHFSNYFKKLENFKEIRYRLVTENDPEIILSILDEIRERWG